MKNRREVFMSLFFFGYGKFPPVGYGKFYLSLVAVYRSAQGKEYFLLKRTLLWQCLRCNVDPKGRDWKRSSLTVSG